MVVVVVGSVLNMWPLAASSESQVYQELHGLGKPPVIGPASRMPYSAAEIHLLKAWWSAAWDIGTAKRTLRQGIKKSRLQCWKDLIGEVEEDPWVLTFKIVIMRLVTRIKTPGLDNPNPVQYIMRRLFPQIESFQRQDRSVCVVLCEEFFTI